MLRLLLLLLGACGCVLAWLLIEQRLLLNQQRGFIQGLSRARVDLQRGLLQKAIGADSAQPTPDPKGDQLVRSSLDAFRQACLRNQLDISRLERETRTLLEAPPAALQGELKVQLKGLAAADLEAEQLFALIRDRFVLRERELGRRVSWALLIEATLALAASLMAFKLFRVEGQMARTLAEKDAQLRLVVDNLPDSYLYQYEHEDDQPVRLPFATSGVERVHGVTAAQVRDDARILLGQLSADQSAILQAAEVESASSMSDISIELKFRRSDGEFRLLRLSSRPRRLHDGRLRWDGFASDVTELRRAELHYQILAEHAFEGIYRSTPQGRLLSVNPSMAQTFGFSSPGQMLSTWKDVRQLYACPADRDEFVRQLQVNGVVREFEFQGRRQDGGLIWISTNARAVTGVSGEIEYYEGTGLEITERKLALERIRQLNRVHCLRTEINQSVVRGKSLEQMFADACAVAVEKGLYHCACVCLLQPELSVSARVGGPLPEGFLDGPADSPVLGPVLRGDLKALNDISDLEAEWTWKAEARQLGYRSLVVLPLKQEQTVTGLFVLFSQEANVFDPEETRLLNELAADISFALNLYQRQQQQLRIQEELRLSQEQFRQAQKMEGIGQLAGGIAHDFNNILAIIMMETEHLLSMPAMSAEAEEGLREIYSSGERAANLTRQLLLFSRRQVMLPAELDLNEVVTQLVKMLRRIIGENIALELKLCPRPVQVRADAGMLDQVLLNLAVNARDAMPQGGTLTVSTDHRPLGPDELAGHPGLAPGPYCVLSVTDSGCGMSGEILEHIFEPFFTTKEVGRGTGLGLATTFGIIQQHRGWIEVSSQPGVGSTFQAFLPACLATPERRAREAVPKPPSPQGRETVLVVEDDANLRRVLARVLRSAGYTVIEACKGSEALAYFESHREQVDMLLTDLVMPEKMTGRELADSCRQGRSDLPVLFISGYSEKVAGQELVLAPGEFFLPKPFTPSQILQSVRATLEVEVCKN
ncbi:MAG: response regulator [Vulcanimicrobiota bacterium]